MQEKGIGYILNKASMAAAQVQPIRGRTSPKLVQPCTCSQCLPASPPDMFAAISHTAQCGTALYIHAAPDRCSHHLCWVQTEAQQHSRLVGMCLLVFLQELQNNAARQATSPEERRQQLKLVQVTALLRLCMAKAGLEVSAAGRCAADAMCGPVSIINAGPAHP